MRYGLFLLLSVVAIRGIAQTPTVKWSYPLHDVSFGQPAAADLDGDGKLEIVFSCYWNDSNVYVLNGQTGALKWKHNLGGCNDAGPLLKDVDGDGKPEVIVASSCNPVTTCFNGITGGIKWQTPTGGSDSPPSVADIDGDGQLEILHGEFNGHVICLNAKTGAIKWDLTVDPNAAIESEPAILDADKDGHLDFIVATWSYSGNNRVLCYKGSDHTLMWQSTLPKDLIYHGPAFGDIDKDGKMEITIGDYKANLFCLNAENGSPLWIDSFPTPYNYIGAPTTLADLDRDHYLDVIYCDAYHVGAVNHNGGVMWTYTIPNYGTAFRGVTVADVNNDSVLDVTFGTSEGDVISLNGASGSMIRSISLRTVYNDTFEIDNAPLIADLDGDGIKDLFIVGGKARYPNITVNYGKAYLLSWGVGKGPDWKMFRHDERRSGCVCDTNGQPLPPLGVAGIAIKKAGELTVYPNPASTLVMVRLTGEDGAGDLRLLDGMGRMVSDRVVSIHGVLSEQLDISMLSPGEYIIEVRTANGIVRRTFGVFR